MVKTIGNPLTWGVAAASGAGQGAASLAERLGGRRETRAPGIRDIGLEDLRACLASGAEDLARFRTDVMLICLLYPVIGGALVWIALDRALLPLLFPLISGFALIGPVAAVGPYELSRRREAGQEAGWGDAFAMIRSPAFAPLFVLGLYLLGLFIAWLFAANAIYAVTLGPAPPDSLSALIGAALGSPAGWAMILVGSGVGFLFALVVLAMTAVSFPMLVHRNVGLPMAVVTSVRVARRNPRTVAAWGLIVAVSLVAGAIPALLGLVLVMPLLGHATWHLYRRAVLWDDEEDARP